MTYGCFFCSPKQKWPALRLACLVDYTDKFSNFFEDLERLDRFAESAENEILKLTKAEEES